MKGLNGWKIGCVVFAVTVAACAQVEFKTVFNFDGTDGYTPIYMFLTQGIDGNFYGTTEFGGSHDAGTVFKITPTGQETVLFNFCSDQVGNICPLGAYPYAGVIQASDGNFYGTTSQGGQAGEGAVYKLTPSGVLTEFYSFCSQGPPCTDGAVPYAPLVQGIDGDLYGTTDEGGAFNEPYGGTVFKITLDGTLTTLHSFGSGDDGNNVFAGLIQATDGSFYGETSLGGANDGGTVFKITADGSLTTIYSFVFCIQNNCTSGWGPEGTLVQGSDGNFYGPTAGGGSSSVCISGCGTIFKLTPGGTLTTLYDFCMHPTGKQNHCPDSAKPQQGLTISSNGYLVGTTNYQRPIIFAITTNGTKFVQFAEVKPTEAGILQATDGTFYGTGLGGTYDDGTVFNISVGLPPFVKTSPTLGPVGESVIILGTNLTGATSVTFNGASAAFTVVSATEITTTVPSGATSGKVKVKTPSGTLTSNLPFAVIQ